MNEPNDKGEWIVVQFRDTKYFSDGEEHNLACNLTAFPSLEKALDIVVLEASAAGLLDRHEEFYHGFNKGHRDQYFVHITRENYEGFLNAHIIHATDKKLCIPLCWLTLGSRLRNESGEQNENRLQGGRLATAVSSPIKSYGMEKGRDTPDIF